MTGRETAPSPTMRWVTVGAVVLVAAVAAVVSYAHMQTVAARAGEDWRSWLMPLSVDGLVVAASMVLLTRQRAGAPGGWLPWAALLGAVGASLAANVAAAEPTATARVVAAWPALAFAVAFELLLSQRRPVGVPVAEVDTQGDAATRVGDVPGAVGGPVGDLPPAVAQQPPAPRAALPTREKSPARRVGGDGDDLTRRVRELLAAGRQQGRPVGRRALARELDVSEHEARRLLAASNGTGGGRS